MLADSAEGFLGPDPHSANLPGATMFDAPRSNKFRIAIEDDVWIGIVAMMMSFVTVCRRSIIGAGAIISKGIPPYSVAVPQQSEVLKRRLSELEVQTHEAALRSQGVINDGDLRASV